MSTIRDLIRDRTIHSLQISESVMTAALYMTQCNIGAIPVMDGERLAGVFSERDMMTRIVAAKRNPEMTRLSEAMTSDLFIVGPDDPVERCMIAMKQHGFRHLPVCEGERLIGFVSLRDLLLYDLDEKEVDLRMMRAYLNAS
jgi:CBS domain-containing protein